MKRIHLACLILLTVLFSCKKDKEDPAPDRQALLTARAWKLDQLLVNGNALPADDPLVANAIGAFSGSNVKFNSDGTFTSTNTTTNSTTAGTWQFTNGEQGLIVNVDTQTFQFTINTLTAGQLILVTPYTITVPVQATLDVELRMVPA